MPTIRLTDVTIAALKGGEAQTDFYCHSTPRFGVRVTQRGTKSFFVFAGTPRRRHHLGRYPDVTLKEARLAAKRLLVARLSEPGTISLLDAFEAYGEQHIDRNYKFRTAKETRRLVNKHLAAFMTRPIGAITKAELTRIIDRLSPSEANHLFGVLRTFFAWCERHDHLFRSPLANLGKPHREKSRERVLSDDELARVWAASERCGTFGRIVRLLVLTGQRKGEIAGLHPSYLHPGQIIWPSTATKNAREQALPASPRVLEMATELCSILVVKPFTAWSKPKVDLDKLSGTSCWTLHDLRRTTATGLAKLGVLPHVVERILNHKSGTLGGVAGIYNRFEYQTEMRTALQRWHDYVQDIVSAAAKKPNVDRASAQSGTTTKSDAALPPA